MAKRKFSKKQRRAPFVPGSTLTLGEVLRDLRSERRLRYGGQTQALQQHQANTTGWFDQYKADIAKQATADQARYTAARQQVIDTADTSQQRSNQQATDAAKQMQADAASRGATYSGQPTQQAVAGTDVRHAAAEAFANLILSQGTAEGTYAGARQNVASAAQLSERLRGQRMGEDLRAEKGAFANQYLAQRRQDESKSVLENLAFGLDQQKAQADIEDKKARRKLTRRQQNITRRGQDISDANADANRDAQKARDRQKAREKRAEHVKDVRAGSAKGMARLHDIGSRYDHYASMTNPKSRIVTDDDGKQSTQVVLDKNGDPVKVKPSEPQIRQQLIKDGFSASEINLALKIHRREYLTPADIQAAHELGIRVPRKLLLSKGAKQKRPN